LDESDAIRDLYRTIIAKVDRCIGYKMTNPGHTWGRICATQRLYRKSDDVPEEIGTAYTDSVCGGLT